MKNKIINTNDKMQTINCNLWWPQKASANDCG